MMVVTYSAPYGSSCMKCRYDPSSRTVMCDLPASPTASAVPSCASTALNDTESLVGLIDASDSPAFHVPVVWTVNAHLSVAALARRGEGAFGACAPPNV